MSDSSFLMYRGVQSTLVAGEGPPFLGREEGASPSSRPRKRSEEHTSELQSRGHLVCRLLLEKKKNLHQPHLELHVIAKEADAEADLNHQHSDDLKDPAGQRRHLCSSIAMDSMRSPRSGASST